MLFRVVSYFLLAFVLHAVAAVGVQTGMPSRHNPGTQLFSPGKTEARQTHTLQLPSASGGKSTLLWVEDYPENEEETETEHETPGRSAWSPFFHGSPCRHFGVEPGQSLHGLTAKGPVHPRLHRQSWLQTWQI